MKRAGGNILLPQRRSRATGRSGFCLQAIVDNLKEIMQATRKIGSAVALAVTVAVAASSVFLAGAAGAQGSGQPDPRGPVSGMATRSVSKYLALERSLQQAISAHDRDRAAGMLDPDFVLRTAASEDMVPLDDWLKDELEKSRQNGRVRDLAVIETDDLATVSFLLDTGRRKPGEGRTLTRFIVDVWRQSTGKLLVRYSDVPTNPPRAPERPSGRE